MPATIHTPTSLQRARRTAASSWLERTNPLAGLSIRAAQRIYDAARGGDFSRIQYLYSEIERENPVLMTCVDRRASALSGLGWKVSTQRDGAEADEQKAALEERLAEAEGMDEALEHLALAFFRGFAHARPVWNGPGRLAGFDLLNGWNFARDPATGTWFWNPRAEYCDPSHPGAGLEEVPRGELVTVSRVRDIDRPAMALALRDAVGARDWGRFLERYGIPFVIFTAPPSASDAAMPRFAEAAEKIADGLSTAVPAGSQVSFAGEARGADPFTPFEEQIHKLIVLMSTGGTLTSLAESGAGTLAGNAQMEVWKQIVKRDGVAIGAAIDRAVCRPLLRGIRDFAGRAPLVKFELGGDRQLEPGEIFDVAAKARQAGYRIAKDELERATGYTLEEDPSAGAGTPGTGLPGGGGFALNAKTPLQFGCSPLQNARSATDGKSPDPTPARALKRILEAFRADLGPAAEELQRVLKLPEAEMRAACRYLSDRLPDLLPKDPAMAAILAEELAGAFAEAAGETTEHTDGTEALANEDREADGQFAPKGTGDQTGGGSAGSAPSDPKKEEGEKKIEVGSTNPDPPEVQAEQLAKAKAAFEKCIADQADVTDAFSRGDIGSIDLRWGDSKKGICHLKARRDAYAAKHPGEPDGAATLARMPETIIKGTVEEVYSKSGHTSIFLVHDGFKAVLTRDREGGNHWLLSGYKIDEGARGYRKNELWRRYAIGEGVNSSDATHPRPTSASSVNG
ncbi:MAG: DUF935 family protein [Kiritimatiellae bacterium]|nr:DUF935 family protein [Kiritimatiellia bacterium]